MTGAEQALLAIDVLESGLAMIYVDDVVLYRASGRDRAGHAGQAASRAA